ncbi:MAG: ATP-dependent Clp protease ATP-binding subunit [Oscillospiraceae bacterium]|nr:ATP-dependent Clp protease ATP-binding subunit [Oscillospiraceae bacterium]
MQPTLCARCHKNMAVVFINRIENGQSHQEGLCLSCARELHIKPIDDMIAKMGISDEELENLTSEMMEAMRSLPGNGEGLMEIENDENDTDDDGKTATFPFLNRLFGAQNGPQNTGRPEGMGFDPAQRPKESGERKSKHKFLDSYCINLNERAREGKLDRVIGRAEELERVIQILNRRQKNNPCLIGEPGVGKTAIAEGLSERIVSGEVPYKLRDKQVYLLDLTSLVAGTQFRGQFEQRMKGLIEEIRREGNIILVIDEVHNLVGAGDAEGSMNAANILKPALSRGEIQVIGATTFNEYRKHIEKDAALERRFQPVTVAEPSIADSVEILMGIRKYYEDFHSVRISDEMCRQAVVLSERYITDRFLPDKAIDLIDEACSDVNLHNKNLARVEAIKKECADLDKERELLLSGASEKEEDYARLATLRSRDLQLKNELSVLESEAVPELTADNLARVIEMWTKIPASSIRADEYEQLAGLADRLRAHIIGQDTAVETVCAAIKRNRAGLQAKRKPVSFIFVGSTGVGKTELVKQLAADMFSTPEALIRLDMSEFMEKFSVSRIIGSPPGYVGYDEAGQLTEKIRRKPYSVVLFDEIEKAHPDVMNILLQILDEGRITDAQGRSVNFENTVIVMTTNAGSDKRTGSVGFNQTADEQGREKAVKALNDFLRPEFINRVDEIVYFNRLTEDNIRDIASLMLNELKAAMAERGMALSWDESVIDYLTKKGYSATYGARNLQRLIQKDIEDAIAAELIDRRRSSASQVGVTVKNGEILVIAV